MEILQQIWMGCWHTLIMMAPYLLLGFFLSGVLSVVMPVGLVKQHLARKGKASVIKSALVGVPLPLCSCGVLPVATWIRRHGASKGATGSFLLATPQTGVDGFLVALSILGIGFAVFIPAAAFVSGIILGLILNLFPDTSQKVKNEEGVIQNTQPVLFRIVRHGYVTVAGDIAIPLGVGILLAGILSAFVHPESFADMGDGLWAKLMVVAAATPLYVCATASLPIGASMLVAGLSPGTVFVFLMAGPATNAATFTTISKLIGKKEAFTYLGCAILLALVMGFVLDALAAYLPEISATPMTGHMEHSILNTVAAVVLVLVLISGKILRNRS
ncbi:permease [Kiritimatiellaeota bacterium B1221]|nr:permease [Kiritimatiellaeota bacterium B1221]